LEKINNGLALSFSDVMRFTVYPDHPLMTVSQKMELVFLAVDDKFMK
jgi:hypothetical protein